MLLLILSLIILKVYYRNCFFYDNVIFIYKIMVRYLAIFTDNHGEEFDVNGFKIMLEKEVNDFEELATSITWEFQYYANSESLTYRNGEDLFSRIEFKEISKNVYESLDKVFGGQFGTFIGEEYLKHILNDEIGGKNNDENDWRDEEYDD